MIDAAERGGVHLVVGPSHSFDRPIQRTREIIDSGAFGAVRMINAQYYTDFLYRPRRPEELVTAQGGGVLFSQAAHQVDIVRLLGGSRVRSVRTMAGAWDPARPTEGAYAALLAFEGGCFASLLYSGYAHFDSDEFCGGTSELGMRKDAGNYGAARRILLRAGDPAAEALLKSARTYGDGAYHAAGAAPGGRAENLRHEHFGPVIVSCDHADLRPLPSGVMIYADADAWLEPLPPPAIPRIEVMDEFHDAIVSGKPPLHDGRWAMATLEICLAMIESAREGGEVTLSRAAEFCG